MPHLPESNDRALKDASDEWTNEMSRQLASKTPAGKDRSPKGLMSGSPFNQPNVHEISSVHSSEASFRARSLLSGRIGTPSDASISQSKFLPNMVESGLSGLNMSDPTREFADESGLVVPPQDTCDLLQGPSPVTSPPKGDKIPKTNESQRDSTSSNDQSQQDSSIIDTSANVPHDSDVPDKTPSPSAKHVSFEITMTQAKQLFMNQLSNLRDHPTEQEYFETDAPSHKETDAARGTSR